MGSSIGFTLTGLWLARLFSDTGNLREFILLVLPLSFSKYGKKLEIILPHTGPIRVLSERRAERTLCWSTLPHPLRSEEHTSALQSLMRITYAGFCLKKNKTTHVKNSHKKC